MDKVMLAYNGMFDLLEIMCNTSHDKWATNQAFVDVFKEFVTKKAALKELCVGISFNGVGETLQKQEYRKNLIVLGGVLSAGLSAYAAAAGDEELRSIVSLAPTRFKKAKQMELAGMVDKLKDIATDKLAVLPPYGIGQPMIDKVGALIKDFYKADEAQKRAKKGHKIRKADIKKAIAEIRDLLSEQLDLCAELVMYDHPEFKFVYNDARRLHIHGRRHLALMLKVVDAQTGAAVSNAVVEIHPENIKRKASKLGNLRIRNLKEGKQRIIITAEGYTTQTLEREYSTEHKLKEQVRMVAQ
jgi:hypothetical protein